MQHQAYDIFLEAGQSNAEGSGIGPVTTEYVPNERILYLRPSVDVQVVDNWLVINYDDVPFIYEIAAERPSGDDTVGDFALTFAEEYIRSGRLAEGRKVLIIRAAIGGTGFTRKHWGMDDPLYKKMIELTDFALAQNPENRLMGFLWHQGEHDADNFMPPEEYRSLMSALVDSVKARYDKTLPFICGGFANEWVQSCPEKGEPIMQVLRELAAAQNGAYVETADLPSNNQTVHNNDVIHFSRESLHKLGRRYFEAYQQLTR